MDKNKYSRGSEWRKWDLQVQPGESSWCLDFDFNDSKIVSRIEAFLEKAIERDIKVIGITDHNFGGSIDVASKIRNERGFDIEILPGVELNATEGWHILIIFNPEWKERNNFSTWQEAVRNFMSSCDVSNPCDLSGNVPLGITTIEILKKINSENIGILFFSHCLGDKGFFRRSNNDSRKKVIKMSIEEGYLFGFDVKNIEEKEQIEKEIQNCLSDSSYKLNLPVICTSDAHEASKVGERFSWIKADPTYEGLKQILYEPKERIFLGDEPELLRRVRENPTKFIKSIYISQVKGYDGKMGIWFKDISIPFNPGLVSIIGNKGAGKSAILDIIALCGNSHQYNEFSFLKEDRFKKDGLAKNFEATLEWQSEEKSKKNLNDNTDKSSPERIRYLPQDYFERLTNALETYEFERTLEEVVFNHLPEEQKLGKNSFEELIKYKKETIEIDIIEIISEIDKLNEKIIELEKKEHPDYEKKIKELLNLKKKELDEHEKIKPKEVKKPETQDATSKKLETLKNKLDNIKKNINDKSEKNGALLQEIEELGKIKQELINLQRRLNKYTSENKEKFKKYGLNIKELVKLEINTQPIEDLIEQKKEQRDKNFEVIGTLNKEKEKVQTEIDKIKQRLSNEQRRYEKYLEDLKRWEEKKKKIIGDEKTPDTIKWLERELEYINKKLRSDLKSLREKRIYKSLEIYDKKMDLIQIYKTFKDYVDKEISEYQNILGEYEINIEATLKLSGEFYDKFLYFINQDRRGSFRGINEGRRVLRELVKKFDFTLKESLSEFLDKIIEYLEYDKREQFKEERRYVVEQVSEKNLKEFYRYVFSLNYIQPVYQLKLGEKNIAQLSPGEKGALLIVFYLMLDKDDIPLLIDQPEENLDNESIYKILTHFIRLTKKKRQIIIVTHNPNLAIVGDAEQIIFVHIDKKNNKFSFESGAIENPLINKRASDILEGTLKAFDIRRLKYLRKYQR